MGSERGAAVPLGVSIPGPVDLALGAEGAVPPAPGSLLPTDHQREPMSIDHVLIAVADARATCAWLWRRHGLAAVEGGAHPGWCTGNWVVPLGRSYLELVRIADPALAGESPFGRRALDALAAGGGPYAWCVAPADFDATAARLGLAVSEGTRRRPDGTVLAWRTAGLETALGDPSRPFFIDWRIRPEDHPGRTPVRHRAGDVGLRRLELAGDEVALRSWLGDEAALVDLVGARATSDPAVLVRPGPPAVSAIAIDAADGPILLESRDWRGR